MPSPPAEDRTSPPIAQRPLELILARNLLTNLSTPGFLLDNAATVVFYNEAAAGVLGRSFEDTGKMSADEWSKTFGPLAPNGTPLEIDRINLTDAIRAGRPAHGEFRIRSAGGTEVPIEASAVPIVAAPHGSSGAMVLFWPLEADDPNR